MHDTPETKQTAILSSQNSQSRLIPYPGVIFTEDLSSPLNSYDLLFRAAKRANDDTNIDALMDTLYETLFLMTAKRLRIALNVPPDMSLREGLERRNPWGYAYLTFSEAALAKAIENDMRDEMLPPGCMEASAVQERAITMKDMLRKHYHFVCKWMEIDFVTGKGIIVDDDDNPF